MKFLECSFQENLVFGFHVILNNINVNQVIDHALPYTAVSQGKTVYLLRNNRFIFLVVFKLFLSLYLICIRSIHVPNLSFNRRFSNSISRLLVIQLGVISNPLF